MEETSQILEFKSNPIRNYQMKLQSPLSSSMEPDQPYNVDEAKRIRGRAITERCLPDRVFDGKMSWLSCVSFIWEQICGQKTRFDKTRVDLPFDMVLDILIRLPAEMVFLCGRQCKPLGALVTSPSFVDAHFIRTATPMIAFHHYIYGDTKFKDHARTIEVHLMDELGQNVVTKSVKMDLVPTCQNVSCKPVVYGSYNGFLIFANYRYDVVMFIWNPVTQEEVSVVAPHPGYKFRGFFFHKATQEYRLLYGSLDDGKTFRYYIVSLRTKCTRRIKNYPHPPSGNRSPVILNEVLHWIICDESYKNIHGVYPSCSDSILSFNTTSEEFFSFPHPGGQCLGKNLLEKKHLAMKLMEMEGLLSLCDHSSNTEIVVWILEDYEMKFWVKMYVLVEPLKKFPFRHRQCDVDIAMEVTHIFQDTVWLSVKSEKMVLYYIRFGTFRTVGKVRGRLAFPVFHVNTLAAIHTDYIVYVSRDGPT